MNPLLNRLFENRSSKKRHRAISLNDDLSKRDKALIPKLNTKQAIDIVPDYTTQRQKTLILKSNKTKLPPMPNKEYNTSQKKPYFRQRKLSIKEIDAQANFMTEVESYHPTRGEQKQQEILQEPRKIKTQVREKQKDEDELFQYLRILEENKELSEEFCYMNRYELPYSYYIVEYEERNPQEYLTVSLRGVSIYKEEQSEFMTVKNLSRQIEVYKKLKKIEFFQNYLYQKVMRHWHYRTVRRKFQGKCRFLTHNLFSQDFILQEYLSELHELSSRFNKCKFINLKISKTKTIQQLAPLLRQNEKKVLESISYFESTIQNSLKTHIDKRMKKFRHDQRVTIGSAQETKDDVYLPYDSKKKAMKYTQMAKLKSFQESMYKLIKYTDLVIFTTKTELIAEGLMNFAEQMESLHRKYEKKTNITSWINVKVFLKTQDNYTKFVCEPSLSDIKKTFLLHKESIMKNIFKHHKLLILEKDNYYCENYDNDTQIPDKLDIKYFVYKNDYFFSLIQHCRETLSQCLNNIEEYLDKGEQTILKIYDESFLDQDIQYYLQNQTLRKYLETNKDDRNIIKNWEAIVQFGIAYADMTQCLQKIGQRFQLKYKQIINAIPIQVTKRCERLAEQIQSVYNMFKQNPLTVMQYIKFINQYGREKIKVPELEKKIQQILEMQEMVFKNGLRIGQNAKIHINQCSTYFRELSKRFDQIQSNEERDRKKFEKIVDEIVQPLDEKAQNLYSKIFEDPLITISQKEAQKVLDKLAHYQEEFEKLKQKKEELFYYQRQLNLGHKDLPNYFRLQICLQWLLKIWKGRLMFYEYQQFSKTQGYSLSLNYSTQKLVEFLKDLDQAAAELETVQLLQNFKHEAQQTLKTLKVCKLVSSEALQQEHFQKIKKQLITKNTKIRRLIFTIEGGKTILCTQLIQESNILDIEDLIEEVVFSALQESIIKKNLSEIQDFWKKNRIHFISEDIARNTVQIVHFDNLKNETLLEKISFFLLSLKNIEGSKHAVGTILQRVQTQINISVYIKNLLEKWAAVEKEWIKLLPLMTNCPSVKHQSNVYFEFTSMDTSLKKLNRQGHDMSSLRRFVDDYKDTKFLNLLKNCERDLIEVNKIFNNFLQMKRNSYHRFFFLADQQLINILENTKDAKTLANYAGLCFNCDRILLDKQLVSGFESKTQTFRLRKAIIRGQPDQMFKSVQENMKNALKFNIIALVPKMRIGMNVEQEHKDYSLQAILVSDKLLWSDLTEQYLNATSYESYELVLRRPCEQLMKSLKKRNDKKMLHKLSIRLVQMMGMREIGQEMIREQITKDDFKWKQQLKYTVQDQQIVVTQFDDKLAYGLEYYPPMSLIIPTHNWNMLLYESHHCCVHEKKILFKGSEGEGKRTVLKHAAMEFGCFYKELVCNKNISMQYISKFVQGAILASAWLNFYEFEHLDPVVLGNLLYEIHEMKNKLLEKRENDKTGKFTKMTNHTMFLFTTHQKHPQKVSVYQFNTFVVVEPNKSKVCEWLLKANSFVEWKQLSRRLIVFVETITPFLDRVMGSEISILRRIIDGACQKKKINSELKERWILAQTFKQQIIEKTSEDIHEVLYNAVLVYLNIDLKQMLEKAEKQDKVSVVCRLIEQKIKNILVVGARSSKTTTIMKACHQLAKSTVMIYPQASEYFFGDQTVSTINTTEDESIIICDGNSLMREWNDLVISGHLMVEGKKVYLNNQNIIELRDVNQCSPSFVGSCQLVYVGKAISKREKFLLLSDGASVPILEAMEQLFGPTFDQLKNEHVELLAQFLKPSTGITPSKNYHRLIVWLLTLLGEEGLWSRYYGGRYNDLTVSKTSLELAPIDETKYMPIEQSPLNLLVPTKSLVLSFELVKHMLHRKMGVYVFGGQGCGKSTLLQFFHDHIVLEVGRRTNEWSSFMKGKLTHVRKEGKNMLMSIGEQDIHVQVDDLDLGHEWQHEYIRRLIDRNSFRDHHFDEYTIQRCRVLVAGREPVSRKLKLADRILQMPLQPVGKDMISTIFRANFQKYIKSHNMSKQVINIINQTTIKTLAISFDDMSNVVGTNEAALVVLRVMRNMMLLPKKNSFISGENYSLLFRTHLRSRLMERALNDKHHWQFNNIFENLQKVTIGEHDSKQTMLYLEKQYKVVNYEKIKEQIQASFPLLYVFDEMISIVAKMNNQYFSLNPNCIIIGRNGTGKRTILRISASINKIPIFQTISHTIMSVLNNEEPILMQFYSNLQEKNWESILHNCNTIEDVQSFITLQHKEKFQELVTGANDDRIVHKIQQKIKHALIFNSVSMYRQYQDKYRNISEYFVTYIHEWPVEALVGISGQNQELNMEVFAEVYNITNQIILTSNENSISIKRFQKYLKVYQEIYQKRFHSLTSKVEFYTKIYSKFNEACNMIREWEVKVDFYRSQIMKSIQILDVQLQKNRQESLSFGQLYRKMEIEQKLINQKNMQMRQTKRVMEENMQRMKRAMDKIEKIVQSMQRSQMSELKKIYKNNQIVSFGLEILCLLFKEEPGEKSINKIMADPNLMMKMKSHSILEERNSKVENKFQLEFPEIQPALETVSESSKTLIEWIKAILQYWKVSSQYHKQNLIYQEHKMVYDNSLQTQSYLQKQIIILKNKTLSLNESYAQQIKKKEQNQYELLKMGEKIKNAQQIIPALKKSEEQTWSIIKEIRNNLSCLSGNCILATVCLIYIPLKKLNLKKRILDGVKKILNAKLIQFSPNFMTSLTDVQDALLQDLNFMALNEVSGSKIIIDPERRALNYILDLDIEMSEGVVKNAENLQSFGEENKIYHTTEENIKYGDHDVVIDWKFTSLNTNEKIFLKLASHKKPEYFERKNEINKKIKKDLELIENYKKEIYEKICQKDIKILDDEQFLETGRKLHELQIETQKNKALAEQKMTRILELAMMINEEVRQIIILVQTLKKTRNIALDIILDIACKEGSSVQNVIRWGLCTLSPLKRSGWLLAIATQYAQDQNEELINIIIKDLPLKVSEGSRGKKPVQISTKNFDNLLKIAHYSMTLKAFTENVFKHPKQFEVWVSDTSSDFLPSHFRIQGMTILEQLTITKIFKHKILHKTIMKVINSTLSCNLSAYRNQQLLLKINPKFPVLVQCPFSQLQDLCSKLNQHELVLKNIDDIHNTYEMRQFLWKSMDEGRWVVLTNLSRRQNRQMLQNIVQYVLNYDLQPNFRVFIWVDQVEEKEIQTIEHKLLNSSRYLESIGIPIFGQVESLEEMLQKNPYTDLSENLSGSFVNLGTSMTSKINYPKKLYTFACILNRAIQIKYPSLFYHPTFPRVQVLFDYLIKQGVTIEFSINHIGQYISKLYQYPFNSAERVDVDQMVIRILDETKIQEKSIYGVLTNQIQGIDEKMKKNTQILGCEDSWIFKKEEVENERIMETLGYIKFDNSDPRDQIPNIRSVFARIPSSLITLNQEFTTRHYLESFLLETQKHNRDLEKIKQFLNWVNMYSKYQEPDNNSNQHSQNLFSWGNLIKKVENLVEHNVKKHRVRSSLNSWVNKVKKMHDFLLYWNLDSPIVTLYPNLLQNFPRIVSSYVINYLLQNYTKIKNEADSLNEDILYSLQPEFSRVKDTKSIYMTDGLILDNLTYHEFHYNFEVRMLDALYEWTGEEAAPPLLLKMKKMPRNKPEDYFSPPLEIATRVNQHLRPLFRISTYIDGHFPEWYLRRPMLISE